MATSPADFTKRIARLKADLIEQARRVQSLMESAFDCAFARDVAAAQRVAQQDDAIDKVDVDIERAAVQLLSDATASGAALDDQQLRMVLTIVKVNNELERIADAGVAVSETVATLLKLDAHLPDTMRIITNSVVGILRDATLALERNDPHLAKVVLASEVAVEQFKRAILRDAQAAVAAGRVNVDMAFVQQEIATQCEITAGHCTNVAEQALYVATGAIVRHLGGHWQEVPLPS
jgi:phosphate transport system protein